jgi:predicted Fe-Mo cluster-binding NifX family protein
MKIAIASSGKDENAQVSPVSGRAEFYLIFEDKKLVETISNPFQHGGGGAGIGVAQMLANKGVEMVISGKFGPNMTTFLDEKGIKYKIVLDKTVKEALEEA